MKPSRLVILVAALLTWGCGSCGTSQDPLPQIDAEIETDTGPDSDDPRLQEQELVTSVAETRSITLPALTAPVHVVRTEADIPHIYASNEHDLFAAAGYVMARDRYFEFDIARRLALGEVSSLLGRFGLDADLGARGQGMRMIADRILAQTDDATGAQLDAFVSGINAYVDAVQAEQEPPPSEYVLAAPIVGVGTPAELLTHADRRAVAAFAAFVMFESSFTDNDVMQELVAESLVDHYSGAPLAALRTAAIEQDLFDGGRPRHDLSVAPGWGLNGALTTTRSLRAEASGARNPAWRAELPDIVTERLRARQDRPALWFLTRNGADRGSNAWAVAPDQTSDGSTLLAGDGHLSLGIPTLFFQMGVDLRTFSDDDPLRAVGLFLPGFPFLGVGTNGEIAWSQTYPRADVMDWYREEITLDADGLPASSLFDGQQRPLVRVDEQYHVASVLGDDPSDVVWPRWETFDGRWITEIEGRTVEDPATEVLESGESIVTMAGTFVVPQDLDGDGKVVAVSFDFTGFDVGNLPRTIAGLQRATSVEEFQSLTADFVGYAQNLLVADRLGNVGFSTFTATPCRDHLRAPDGSWLEGGNPQRLLDGTRFGGFEVPIDADGRLDPTPSADPAHCMIPFDVFPRVVKNTGYVQTANHDPAGATFDDSLTNDPAYIGGPWVPGYRARAIEDGLIAAAGSADVAAMAAIQAHHGSQVGRDFGPELLRAVAAGQDVAERPEADLTESELRLRQLFLASNPERLEEAARRIDTWLQAGAEAASGVETFYNQPTPQDLSDAVATMIFNAWLREWIQGVFADEDIDLLISHPGRNRGAMIRALLTLKDGRGPDNPMNLAGWNPDTEESVFFDDLNTPEIERSEEIAVAALAAALAFLESEVGDQHAGGFGTADMDQWLWGLKHRVRLDSLLAAFGAGNPAVDLIAKRFAIDTKILPLAEELADDDPRRRLRWFPRPGDYFGVDAANPSFFGPGFDYSDGPVMRMVIRLAPDGAVSGQNIIPAGQSGLNDSPHFADQAALWLGNEALPMRYSPADVVAGAVGREYFHP